MSIEKGKGRAMDIDLPLGSESTLPWVEKYRPANLEDVVSHKDIISTRKIDHHFFLFFSNQINKLKNSLVQIESLICCFMGHLAQAKPLQFLRVLEKFMDQITEIS